MKETSLVEDPHTAIGILSSLLEGTGLAGFSFGTFFVLRVERSFADRDLPWSLELRLDCSWWFGQIAAWKERIRKHASNDLADPEEGIQASDLVRLRWTDGSSIEKVSFDGAVLKLLFANAWEIQATAAEPDESWEVVESGRASGAGAWSVRFEHGRLAARRP